MRSSDARPSTLAAQIDSLFALIFALEVAAKLIALGTFQYFYEIKSTRPTEDASVVQALPGHAGTAPARGLSRAKMAAGAAAEAAASAAAHLMGTGRGVTRSLDVYATYAAFEPRFDPMLKLDAHVLPCSA